MSDTSYRFYTVDVSKEDLTDVSRRPRTSGIKALARWVLAASVCFGLLVALIRGAQPELTPEQIVRLETYQGVQKARKIFNLNGEKVDSATSAVVPLTGVELVRTEMAPEILSDRPVPDIEVLAVAANAEIPPFTRAVPSEVVSKFFPGRSLSSRSREIDGVAPRVLPLYTVVAQRVQLHEAPSHVSRVLKSLFQADTVTLFSTDGEWVEVGANDGSGITGFVPRSDVVAQEPQ